MTLFSDGKTSMIILCEHKPQESLSWMFFSYFVSSHTITTTTVCRDFTDLVSRDTLPFSPLAQTYKFKFIDVPKYATGR